jgi:hypothetical protein
MTRVLLILLLVTAVSGIAPAQEPADDEKKRSRVLNGSTARLPTWLTR